MGHFAGKSRGQFENGKRIENECVRFFGISKFQCHHTTKSSFTCFLRHFVVYLVWISNARIKKPSLPKRSLESNKLKLTCPRMFWWCENSLFLIQKRWNWLLSWSWLFILYSISRTGVGWFTAYLANVFLKKHQGPIWPVESLDNIDLNYSCWDLIQWK